MNDDELRQLSVEQARLQPNPDYAPEDPVIRSEIMQLKHRLAGTDQELQKTNHTLRYSGTLVSVSSFIAHDSYDNLFRRLGDEMRSMSLEKSRQREAELAQEVERLQMEIKSLQKSSEEAANVNQQLSKEVRSLDFEISLKFYNPVIFIICQVKDVEDQINQRKAEVEKLIQEMREANMESLAISPPEESKQFLDGN